MEFRRLLSKFWLPQVESWGLQVKFWGFPVDFWVNLGEIWVFGWTWEFSRRILSDPRKKLGFPGGFWSFQDLFGVPNQVFGSV